MDRASQSFLDGISWLQERARPPPTQKFSHLWANCLKSLSEFYPLADNFDLFESTYSSVKDNNSPCCQRQILTT